MQPRYQNRRIMIIAFCALLLGVGATLLFSALKQNTQFFYDPSEILTDGFVSKSEAIRIGGLVLTGSVEKGDGISTTFKVGDFIEGATAEPLEGEAITVTYVGILPDLFREGQGVVVTGKMLDERHFIADEVLAKHDENYQPKT